MGSRERSHGARYKKELASWATTRCKLAPIGLHRVSTQTVRPRSFPPLESESEAHDRPGSHGGGALDRLVKAGGASQPGQEQPCGGRSWEA